MQSKSLHKTLLSEPKPNFLMSILQGECYEVNSFHLGFINVLPIPLCVVVNAIDYRNDYLDLRLKRLPDRCATEAYEKIEDWFIKIYPTMATDETLLKSPALFQHLVNQKIARLTADY
jgi:hypothetical protein